MGDIEPYNNLGIKVVNSQYNSEFSKKLNSRFYWFGKVLIHKAKERVKEFLLSDMNLKIVGICEKDNVFFAGEEYFVTRIKINRESEIFFRISADFMDIILTHILGKADKKFATENLTELEAKILTSLNDYIYKGISPFLVKDNDDKNKNQNLLHITLVSHSPSGATGKMIISFPVYLLPEISDLVTQQNFGIGSFPKYKIPVKIITGKSEISLYDLKHMEHGDIVVLEKSNIKTMTIDVLGRKKKFLINPETSIITGVDNNEGETMDNTNSENMWDVIPVEITAEFEKVTITLGELKQISEGSIVDVGALYENKVLLKVENKPVATGELIIINDKYAVRVDEVYTDESQRPATPAAPNLQNAPSQPQPQAQAAPQQNNADFNYDNFDIEDEDI